MSIQYESSKRKRWTIEFSFLICITAVISGLSYLVQSYIFDIYDFDTTLSIDVVSSLIRAIRMVFFYVIPSVLFIRRWNGSIKDTGIFFSEKYLIRSLLGGIIVYLVATYIFVQYEIFFDGWIGIDTNSLVIRFVLVGIMAAITDFWTRGFILLELSNKYGDKIAIIVQNITWFVIHIYEIELLEPYIGVWLAIGLTLFLGIGGDLVALKTRSITGLMIGHIILNLSILLAANGHL